MLTHAATARRRPRRTLRRRVSRFAERTLLYVVAAAFAISAAVPFLWTLSTSLKSGSDQILAMPPQLIPRPAHWANYVSLWQGYAGVFPFQRWLWNSIQLTGLNLIGEIAFGAAAGYGFARFRFRGRSFLFTVMLSGMLLPWAVRIVPTYMMFARLRWTNTFLPLILPNWFGGAYLTFLFRQYFVSIPRELDDAAKIDGAGSFGVLRHVILPLAKPILATAAIFVFMHNWNNFIGPLIFLRSVDKLTLAVGMRWFQLQGYTGAAKEAPMAAYAVLMALPVIVLFFSAQRYFVQGVQLSVSKE
jgi:multiple sugar transport system permease protein